MLFPIDIPPGVHKNGTEYEAKGRWNDASLIRWRAGWMGPIRGWRQWGSATFSNTTARGMISWRDDSGNRWLALGTHNSLLAYDDDAAQATITPAGLTSGAEDASGGSGYGADGYGDGLYGPEDPDTGSITPATTWSLDTWGEYLVACSNADGKLYEWQLDFATPTVAAAISGAPTGCEALVVTAERFLFALGSGGIARRVRWCDQGDNTTWTAAATNQAGQFDLETEGEILCGRRVRGRTLILTTKDAWTAEYIGYPLVYSFEQVGTGCGIIAPLAIATFQGNAIWLGRKGFYVYDGVVRPLECELIDFLLTDLAQSQLSKIVAWHNHQYNEVWFMYPSDSQNEVSDYVAWNYIENHWSMGVLARTSAAEAGVFSFPILAGSDGKLYEHEAGTLDVTNSPYAESGPIEIAVGERRAHVLSMIPDEKSEGDAQVVFKHREYPNTTETAESAVSLEAPTDVRFSCRQFKVRVEGAETAEWRWGVPRLEVRPGGRR